MSSLIFKITLLVAGNINCSTQELGIDNTKFATIINDIQHYDGLLEEFETKLNEWKTKEVDFIPSSYYNLGKSNISEIHKVFLNSFKEIDDKTSKDVIIGYINTFRTSLKEFAEIDTKYLVVGDTASNAPWKPVKEIFTAKKQDERIPDEVIKYFFYRLVIGGYMRAMKKVVIQALSALGVKIKETITASKVIYFASIDYERCTATLHKSVLNNFYYGAIFEYDILNYMSNRKEKIGLCFNDIIECFHSQAMRIDNRDLQIMFANIGQVESWNECLKTEEGRLALLQATLEYFLAQKYSNPAVVASDSIACA